MKKIVYLFLFILLCIPSQVLAKDVEFLDIKIGKSYGVGEKLILSSDSPFYLATPENQRIKDLNTDTFTVIYRDGKISLVNGNFTMVDFPHTGEMVLSSNSPILVENSKLKYHGGMSFRINNKKLDLINHVGMEDYLKGVLPKEMSSSFPHEALKAQAVCSRSFALSNIHKYKKFNYNLNDTTSSQVYRGITVEEPSTNKAVEETHGEIVTYNGEVANTIFCASSGGKTASAHEVWGGEEIPYLLSHEDHYSTHPWEFKITKENMDSLGIGRLKDIKILEKDSSGRIKKLKACGNNCELELSGLQFRNKFGNTKLKNTYFNVEKTKDGFLLKGNGYGHGVGMSQYGAVEMAKSGVDYREILSFYFEGTELEKQIYN